MAVPQKMAGMQSRHFSRLGVPGRVACVRDYGNRDEIGAVIGSAISAGRCTTGCYFQFATLAPKYRKFFHRIAFHGVASVEWWGVAGSLRQRTPAE
ncbi:MAG TPA: hypothetical protein VMV78_09255 [Thiobacillus sp.]|jgi:hypothetical protein|nr:hypothetical protein [Thiobacillus sp.]